MTYLEQIEELISRSTFIGATGNTLAYEIEVNSRRIVYKLYRGDNGDWVDFCQYKDGSSDYMWNLCNVNKLYRVMTKNGAENDIKFTVYSFRKYEEPKLSKPKELKGIKPIGSAVFIPKHCSPQVFVKDNDVWIKHTDYMSAIWIPLIDDFCKDQSYYVNKYFGGNRSNKFVYADNWGSIVLRNEAWLLIKNMVSFVEGKNKLYVPRTICDQQFKWVDITSSAYLEWQRFWENVYDVVEKHLEKGKE